MVNLFFIDCPLKSYVRDEHKKSILRTCKANLNKKYYFLHNHQTDFDSLEHEILKLDYDYKYKSGKQDQLRTF